MLSRRRLLASLAVVASAARAEGARVWKVGFLSSARRPASIKADRIGAFVRGMRELGYVEGRNLVVEWRFAAGDGAQLRAMARELVALAVDVIVTAGVPPTAAAKEATSTIPIVMGTSTDPLGSGLVASLARPGGNVTGLSNASVDIGPKHVQMLRETVPRLASIVMLCDPATSSHAGIFEGLSQAAARVGIASTRLDVADASSCAPTVEAASRGGAGGVVIPVSPLLNQETRALASACLARRLPAVSGFLEFAAAGGLMSYGQNLADHYFRAASYVDRLFKGATADRLPIEQPTRFELVLNRSTEKALGLVFPASLTTLADATIP